MNKLSVLLVIFCFMTCAYHPQQSCAADMGGQLKLKDDSKQELKKVMKQIKEIANYKYEFSSDGTIYKVDQGFDSSGCKIKKTSESDYLYNRDEINLSDIDTVEIETNKYGFIQIKLKTINFDKKILSECVGLRRNWHDTRYNDYTEIAVSKDNSVTLLDLMEKAVQLCADK